MRRALGVGGPAVASKKLTRPGGQPGGSGSARGWMRRPCRTQIHDRSVFERSGIPVRVKKTRQERRSVFWDLEVVWSEKTLLKQQPSQPQKSVTAGTDPADVIAESVE